MTFKEPLIKTIKIYNNRQQIHLTKADDFKFDTAVILDTDNYESIMTYIKKLEDDNDILRADNESKDAEISALTNNQDTAIKDIKDQLIKEHQDKIDDYQKRIDDYQADKESHINQINDLKGMLIDVSSKYNMLRLAIAGTSRLKALFIGHKDLLSQYPEHHLEYDDESIMIEPVPDDTTEQ